MTWGGAQHIPHMEQFGDIIIGPLTAPVEIAGWPQQALYACELHHLQLPPTRLIVVPLDTRTPLAKAAAAAVRQIGAPVTLSGWLVPVDRALASRPASVLELDPTWFNLDPSGAEQGLAELAGLACRRAPNQHKWHLVAVCQLFVRATASAAVWAGDSGQPVIIQSCWGLTEGLTGAFDHDTLVLESTTLTTITNTVSTKPIQVVAASGGTHAVAVPTDLRATPSVSMSDGRRLASKALHVAAALSTAVELDIALTSTGDYLVACRPQPAPDQRARERS